VGSRSSFSGSSSSKTSSAPATTSEEEDTALIELAKQVLFPTAFFQNTARI
jgi:hypothetical protein